VSGSLFSKSTPTEPHAYASEEVTGSVERTAATSSALPAEADLVFARKAIVDVLTHGTKAISSPWESPATGARGTVTPVANSYAKDGATCRDFLASYVRRQGAEVWMQGQACRAKQGPWEVKNMRPWSRT
jgi:surface antigen